MGNHNSYSDQFSGKFGSVDHGTLYAPLRVRTYPQDVGVPLIFWAIL